MTREILITPTANGFMATVLGLPECEIEAPTREEAIEKVVAEAETLLANSEIVQIELNGTPKPKSFAGMWADDKTFDAFIAAMKAYREEVNADPNQL